MIVEEDVQVADAQFGARGPALGPGGSLAREHELDVERVAAVTGNDVRPDRAAQEGEVPDQVQHLVPDELVPVSKAVQRPAIAEHDRVVQGTTPRETVLPHEPQVLEEAVRTG